MPCEEGRPLDPELKAGVRLRSAVCDTKAGDGTLSVADRPLVHRKAEAPGTG